jgi:N-acetylmuramoyl-L-alanine amidase
VIREDFGIAVDIGHTRNEPGATSSRGVAEFYFNRNVARLLLKELVARDFKNSFIIDDAGDDISLAHRADVAHKRKASLFISIHHDSVQPSYLSTWLYRGRKHSYCDLFSGYSLFYSRQNQASERSLAFARLLGLELKSSLFVPTRHHAEKISGEGRQLIDEEKGIYEFDDLFVLKTVKMPALLVECGLIVNRCEEVLLGTPKYQWAFVTSVGRAVEKFWKLSFRE